MALKYKIDMFLKKIYCIVYVPVTSFLSIVTEITQMKEKGEKKCPKPLWNSAPQVPPLLYVQNVGWAVAKDF